MTQIQEEPDDDEDPPPHGEFEYKMYVNRRKNEGLPVLPRPGAPQEPKGPFPPPPKRAAAAT